MNNYFNFKTLDKSDLKKENPQVLAFVGDGVYTLFIRNKIVLEHHAKSGELHKLTTDYVKASKQSVTIEKLMPILTEDEMSVYKRARNYKTASVAKNASVVDYKRATGLEAVLGYLYLAGDQERLNYILSVCIGENNENWRKKCC